MSRLQLALNVEDLATSIDFYRRLFATEPAKVRTGYANFAITEPPLKLVLIENPGHGGSLNHLGIEVDDVDGVDAVQRRLETTGLRTLDERDTTCCYARQDKFWVSGVPDGEPWEVYTVLDDSLTPHGGPEGQVCCTTSLGDAASPSPSATAAAPCCG